MLSKFLPAGAVADAESSHPQEGLKGERMNYKEVSAKILEYVGKDNILSYTHCATRLRFTVSDRSVIQEEKLKEIPEIMQVIDANGQHQLVIGPDVENLYDTIAKELPPEKASAVLDINEDAPVGQKPKDEVRGINRVFRSIVNCFVPVLPAMVATGLIKGILALLSYFALIDTAGGTYLVLSAMGDTLFYFFPIIVGYNCGKEFGCSSTVTALIGASLVYPTVVSAFNEGLSLTFLGIPLILKNYTASLLPVIAGSYLASKVEKFMKKITPAALKIMLVPFVTLLVSVPITFLIVGPVITEVSNLIAAVIRIIFDVVPVLASGIVAAFWQLLVLTGMHYGTTSIVMDTYLEFGYDPTGASVSASMVALAGAALALFLRTRNVQEKSTSVSACISALLGITEPALYTVGLVHRKCLYSSIIAGGLAGIVGGVLGAKVFGLGANPLTQLAMTFTDEGFYYTFAWCAVQIIAFVGAFVLSYIWLGRDNKKKA